MGRYSAGLFVRYRCIERAKRKVSSKQRQQVCQHVGRPTFKGESLHLPPICTSSSLPRCEYGLTRTLFNGEGATRGETFVTRKARRAVAAITTGLLLPRQPRCKATGARASLRRGHVAHVQHHDLTILCSRLARHSRSQLVELPSRECRKEIVWDSEGVDDVGHTANSPALAGAGFPTWH